MSAQRREIFKLAKEEARKLGVGGKILKYFLRGTPEFSLTSPSREDIRRSLKYADDTLNHRERAQVPSLLMIAG